MIHKVIVYEVHVGPTEPARDSIHPDQSSTKGEKFSGPHRSWLAARCQLLRARRAHPFAWITFASTTPRPMNRALS